MPLIKNSTEIASDMVSQINRVKEEFELMAVSLNAAKNVPVDEDCDQSYRDGVSITAAFQTYLSKASEFVGAVSQKLDSADQQVVKSQSSVGICNHGLGGLHE